MFHRVEPYSIVLLSYARKPVTWHDLPPTS